MVSKLLLTSLLILMPMAASAENCLLWLKCPFKELPGNADSRYLAMNDATLPADTVWTQVIVSGAGVYDLGQALVCVVSSSGTAAAVKSAATTPGDCEEAGREQVEAQLVHPYVPYYDDVAGQIRLRDGQDGRELEEESFSISPIITDTLVDGLE